MTHAQDFLTRQGAEDFVARLRREIPEGEFVVQVVSLRNLTPPLPLDQFLLLGPWPHQSRSK